MCVEKYNEIPKKASSLCKRTYILLMAWEYQYDKEGYWCDTDSGKERFAIKEGALYALPHISKKSLEIRSVIEENGIVTVELFADSHTAAVSSAGDSVTLHVSHQYSVAGDTVDQSLCLSFTLEEAKEEN